MKQKRWRLLGINILALLMLFVTIVTLVSSGVEEWWSSQGDITTLVFAIWAKIFCEWRHSTDQQQRIPCYAGFILAIIILLHPLTEYFVFKPTSTVKYITSSLQSIAIAIAVILIYCQSMKGQQPN